MKSNVLVVDDEPSIREFLQIFLKKEGYDVQIAKNGIEALESLKKKDFKLLISDLQMPKMTGIELLKEVQSQGLSLIFIIMTAFGTTESAVEAMKLGAYDYILKPFKIDEVRIILSKALDHQQLEVENRLLKKELGETYSFHNLIGNSKNMHEIFNRIKKASSSLVNILITGESGTGKEMIAKAVHYSGSLKEKIFVPVNCGAIPQSIIESELFGHKKGAFTGAVRDKKGLFEAAHGGSLFLDEVGELPMASQAKLLRVLQEKCIRPVGGTEDIPVDVRIISATNKDLEALVKKNKFREDLFYRLNVLRIRVPPLREHRDDIPLLAKHFLEHYNMLLKKNIKAISEEALNKLSSYDYPGNIRELENFIERTVALESGTIILPENLPSVLNQSSSHQSFLNQDLEVTNGGIDLEKIVGQIEKELLVKAIQTAKGVKKKAAKLLGITFRSMRYRLKKYDLGD